MKELIQVRDYLDNLITQLCEEQDKRLITTGANTLIFVEKVDNSFGTPYRYFASIASISNPFYEKKSTELKKLRCCFKCKEILNFSDVLRMNPAWKKNDLEIIWNSEVIELYCCKCFKKIKKLK